MDFPELFAFDTSQDELDAAKELARQLEALEIEAPFVLCSTHGRRLASEVRGPRPPEAPRDRADQHWAVELGARAQRSGADAIVAVGGGRCLDVAKLAAGRAGLAVISVPTQLSHDGICSPVAVVPNADGTAESIGAIAPRAVFLSVPTIATAPVGSLAAGLGDLLSNPLALRDWALAVERGLEVANQRAWDLSVQSFDMIEGDLDRDPASFARDPVFVRRLADALVLSGMAMVISGTSRPASGGEHEISHAIDELYSGRAMHGAQVAFGCIASVQLYGEDAQPLRARLRTLGLPQHPSELGMTLEDTARVLLHAPETRPGRFTVLEASDLDETRARALIKQIWGDG